MISVLLRDLFLMSQSSRGQGWVGTSGESLLISVVSLQFSKIISPVEYYPAIKRNKIGSLVVRWIDLESIKQSEVSQKEKNKHILLHMYGI